MKQYSVKQLSEIAGVSVRTLHLYDEMGLLSPAFREESGYRKYGERELLRLQQILFYKELGLPLQEIKSILSDPDFDILTALTNHRKELLARKKRITEMLSTIDKTVNHLKTKTMLSAEELYEGLPKETAEEYRREAMKKYGAEAQRAENHLRKLNKEEIRGLKEEQASVTKKLASLLHTDPTEKKVQDEVARHYAITRKFWGTENLSDKQYEAYRGLADLYVSDERFTMDEDKPRPQFAAFLNKAMKYFAEKNLK